MNDKFELLTLGADLTKLGFKLQQKNMYDSLTSPFAEDQQRPHPFKVIFPQSFNNFDFSVDKIDKQKLPEDNLLYIFYNLVDDKMQFMAVELLISKKINYYRPLKLWVKDSDKGKLYFNISAWKWMDFRYDTKEDDFVSLKTFKEAVSK